MALDSFTTLQASIASWLARADLTTIIPDFIALFEARARRELRDWLTTTVSLTNLTGDTALAATVDSVLSVAYNDGIGGVRNHPLDLLSFADYHALLEQNSAVRSPTTGVYPDRDEVAETYTLRFYPPCSAASPIAALAVLCVGYLPALSDSATSNRLLETAPDLYLYGSLAESAPFLQHDERLPMWTDRAAQGVKALQLQTERKRTGANPRPAKLPVVFGERV